MLTKEVIWLKNNNILVFIVIVITLAGGFFAGMTYQKGKQPTFPGRAGNGNQGGRGQFTQGARPVAGEIIAADDKSVTVKLRDGSTKIMIISDKTTINKAVEGTKADLKVGEQVTGFGQDNSDGSVTAQNIQLRSGMPFPSGSGGQ